MEIYHDKHKTKTRWFMLISLIFAQSVSKEEEEKKLLLKLYSLAQRKQKKRVRLRLLLHLQNDNVSLSSEFVAAQGLNGSQCLHKQLFISRVTKWVKVQNMRGRCLSCTIKKLLKMIKNMLLFHSFSSATTEINKNFPRILFMFPFLKKITHERELLPIFELWKFSTSYHNENTTRTENEKSLFFDASKRIFFMTSLTRESENSLSWKILSLENLMTSPKSKIAIVISEYWPSRNFSW